MQIQNLTLSTVEIAEMLDNTPHKDILKKLEGRNGRNGKHTKGYIEILTERQMSPSDFFFLSSYKDASGKENKCYKVTKKGCEFLANKFTGEKGVIFTARYINRFHEMQDILERQQEPELPWFIRDFGKNGKIMLFRDFKSITGIELLGTYTALKRPDRLVGGFDYNGWGWKCDNEKFKAEYGFDYGDDDCMHYLYLRGIRKAVRAIENDLKDGKKLTLEAKKMILDGVQIVEGERESPVTIPKKIEQTKRNPIQICITIGENGIVQQM